MRVAIYARVSTKKQDTENQIHKLVEYAKLRGWEVVGRYVDPAVSGKKASRPQLDEMKEKIKHGKIDAVLVWKLDRLGRSTRDLIDLLDFFRLHNCAFISYNNNMDTTTAEGRLLYRIIASFAEFEAELISERTKLAYERKVIHAKNIGQRVRWGRKKSDVDTSLLFRIKKENPDFGLRKIADEYNSHFDKKNHVSYSTVRRVFQNSVGKNER